MSLLSAFQVGTGVARIAKRLCTSCMETLTSSLVVSLASEMAMIRCECVFAKCEAESRDIPDESNNFMPRLAASHSAVQPESAARSLHLEQSAFLLRSKSRSRHAAVKKLTAHFTQFVSRTLHAKTPWTFVIVRHC